jgi:hypothetical protein
MCEYGKIIAESEVGSLKTEERNFYFDLLSSDFGLPAV